MDKQPKTHRIEDAEGLTIGDYVEDDGFIWRVYSVEGLAINCRRLNYFERVKQGFKQWLKRRKEKKHGQGNVKNNSLASS